MNRHCREARSHESLDQTRTGTIVCSEQSSARSLYNAIISGGWNGVFSGNCAHLRIENIASVRSEQAAATDEISRAQLSGVTSLDISCSPENAAQVQNDRFINGLLCFLPNLREIDFSHFKISKGRRITTLEHCPRLERITANCSGGCFYMGGYGLQSTQGLITMLYLDGSCLLSPGATVLQYESSENVETSVFMFVACRGLERLSIKSAKWHSTDAEFQAISQGMLMKMVRNHPTLRWLRSDLTEENVEILKRERPEITFVTE